MDKFGYRFIVHNGDVYFMRIQAFQWRFRSTADYDTLDYKVLSIVNGRTLEKVESINGTGVMEKGVNYVVGQRISLPANTKHGVYFFENLWMLFTTYIQFDENMVPYWNHDDLKKKARMAFMAILNKEARTLYRRTLEDNLEKWRNPINSIWQALNNKRG